MEFFPLDGVSSVRDRYPDAQAERWRLTYPITAVEVQMRVGGTAIEFGPRTTKLGGIQMTNCFASHCGVGVLLG